MAYGLALALLPSQEDLLAVGMVFQALRLRIGIKKYRTVSAYVADAQARIQGFLLAG